MKNVCGKKRLFMIKIDLFYVVKWYSRADRMNDMNTEIDIFLMLVKFSLCTLLKICYNLCGFLHLY